MEQHGSSTENKIIAIIPARFDSVRLPGKLLLPLGEKPLILHTLERVIAADSVDSVLVATDSEEILEAVTQNGFQGVLTNGEFRSGTDRIAAVAAGLENSEIIVNVQADEPFINPKTIDDAVRLMLENPLATVTTAYTEVSKPSEVLDPNSVKVVTDETGRCIYFSRSAIPFPRDDVLRFGSLENALESDGNLTRSFKKHLGIYVYRRDFLIKFAKFGPTRVEETESLEQLRVFAMGGLIYASRANVEGPGVDTEEDYRKAIEYLAGTVNV